MVIEMLVAKEAVAEEVVLRAQLLKKAELIRHRGLLRWSPVGH
jgi:hypothetical protein